MSVRTPGMQYFVRLYWPDLQWQVVQITEAQARAMLARGERPFPTAAQAHAVARRLNKKEETRRAECPSEQ